MVQTSISLVNLIKNAKNVIAKAKFWDTHLSNRLSFVYIVGHK